MRIKDIAQIILTAVSVVSSIAAVVMAVHDTPRAIEILDDHRLEIDPSGETDLPVKEKVVDYAKGYWKTGVLLGVSVVSSIASCVIGHRNYRALAASTAVISTAYAKHKDKVKKFLGEEKAKLIEQQVKKEMEEESKNPTELKWFYDTVSETYFQMTMNDFKDCKLKANEYLATEHKISLGEAIPFAVNSMADKKYADYTWFDDDLLDAYGYSWLYMTLRHYNAPNSEDADLIDPFYRDGKETYVIKYEMWPIPPAIARNYQYIGAECN